MPELIDLDIDSIECAASRPVPKKAKINSNPLHFSGAEHRLISSISADLGKRLQIKSSAIYYQVLTFQSAIQGIQYALDGNWAALIGAAQSGLEASFNVQNTCSYIISKQDSANRDIASDERIGLKEIAMRLAHAAPSKNRIDADRAMCLRAMIYASIAAERGIIHIVQSNLGVVINTLHHVDFPERTQIAWTNEILDLAKRYRQARIKLP